MVDGSISISMESLHVKGPARRRIRRNRLVVIDRTGGVRRLAGLDRGALAATRHHGSGVGSRAGETGSASSLVLLAAQSMSRDSSNRLKLEVVKFPNSVRAA
jgi:hypothetical protein